MLWGCHSCYCPSAISSLSVLLLNVNTVKFSSLACLEQTPTIKLLCSEETDSCVDCVWVWSVKYKRELCCPVLCPLCVNLIASLLPSGRKYFEHGQGPALISCLQTEAPTAEQHWQDEKWQEGGFSEYPRPTTGIHTTVQISIVYHCLLLFLAYYLFILES